MTFLSPDRLVLLVVVAGLAGAYVAAHRRTPKYAVRFTNLDLLDTVAPHRPGWRRHVPAVALIAAVLALVLALARPARLGPQRRTPSTIVAAVDVSPSMMATDVAPTRFAAMQDAVRRLARLLPGGVRLGLVSFAGTAQVVVAPSTDHDLVRRAVGHLQLRSETALGEAILTALDALDPPGRPGGGQRAGVVLMSDGGHGTTTGRSEADALERARAAGVPVSTIAFGTNLGQVVLDGRSVAVPVQDGSLEHIAQQTGGEFFPAVSTAGLTRASRVVGGPVAPGRGIRQLAGWFVAAGLVLAVLAAVLSLAWFSRIP